jgi:intracellular septation protein A
MRRVLMLFGALWPAIYMVFFIVLVVEATVRNGGDPDNDLLVPFGVVMALHITTMLIILAAAVAFVIHAWRNSHIDKDQRMLWVLVLLLGAPIAMPIYWWLYVRHGGTQRAPESQLASSP